MATTNPTALRDKALREAALPHVQALLDGLMAQGMTRAKALETIRWATYRLTKPDLDEAPEREPGRLYVFGGKDVQP